MVHVAPTCTIHLTFIVQVWYKYGTCLVNMYHASNADVQRDYDLSWYKVTCFCEQLYLRKYAMPSPGTPIFQTSCVDSGSGRVPLPVRGTQEVVQRYPMNGWVYGRSVVPLQTRGATLKHL